MFALPVLRKASLISASLLLFNLSGQSFANSLSVGYQSSDYTLELAQENQDVKLTGASLFGSIDLTDKFSLSAEVSDLSNDKQIEQALNADVDSTSWTVSASYNLEDSYMSVQYTDISQEEVYTIADRPRPLESQDADYEVYSATYGYDWTLDNWQVGSSVGLHYSEWEQIALRRPAMQNPIDTINEDGHSTFISVSLDVSRYHAWSDMTDMIFGAGVTWNELIEDKLTQSISSTIRPNSPNRPSPNNIGIATGTKSYAQVNAYLAFFTGEHWQLDVSTSLDTESEQDGQFWSVNIGYNF